MAAGTFERLIAHIAGAARELENRLEPDNVLAYFEQLGARFPASFTTNVSIAGALSGARSAAGALGGLLASFNDADQNDDSVGTIAVGGLLSVQVGVVIDALGGVADAIASTAGAWAPLTEAEVLDFVSSFPRRVLDERLVIALENNRAEFVSAGVLLGFVDRFEEPVAGAESDNPPVFRRELRLDRLTDALAGGAYFQSLFGWGSSPLNINAFLARLEAFLNVFSFNTVIDTSVSSPVLHAGAMTVELNAGTNPPGINLVPAFSIPSGFAVTMPVGTGYQVDITTTGTLAAGKLLTIVPPTRITASEPLNVRFVSRLSRVPIPPKTSIVLFGQTGATRLEVQSLSLGMGLELRTEGTGARGDFFSEARAEGGKAVVDFSGGDGFLKSLTGGKRVEADFELAATYSIDNGLKFEAGGQFSVRVPLHVSFAGLALDNLIIALPIGAPGRQGLPFDIATTLTTSFGPFTVLVDGVGLELDVTFGSGNLGVANISPDFKFPTGVGVSLDGAGVSGGGFLSFDESRGRYAGSIELSVFSVAVKAFGLVETRFPDGREGFSLVVVISAEFTPVQLGFGFTLNGVGGLLGVNRGFVAEALGEAIRSGSVAHLLFPRDPVRDAPAILNDLETIFPASPGHHVFGPMAKLGWGTPTLITADLGIVIEFPGPRLAVVGVAQTALPTRQFGLVRLNLAIGGVLDFPKRTFSLDASLFDSVVGSFPVSGEAAFRLSFGDQPNFALSIGGFNPSFKPPANFPKLQRVSVDLGVNGNPSLTLQGYLALTSNTAQIGAAISLRASGAGIRLTGHLSFDALFVFSPFSFEAAIDAGVRVSFHGVGLGVHLHGHLSGPTPWRVRGEVCVSVLWWDACLGFDASFGKKTRAELPAIDPWEPENSDPELPIVGLRAAVEDARNWSASPPPAALSVVSLAESTSDSPPIDPMGAATLRQKTVPLNQKITKFGAFKPLNNDTFTRTSVKVGSFTVDSGDIVAVKDHFAPDHFKEMKAAERLSAPAYQEMEAGFTIDPELVRIGPISPKEITYETELLDGDRRPTAAGIFTLTQRHLRGMLARSAAGLSGLRRTGALRYVVPRTPVKVRLPGEEFAIADRCALTRNDDLGGPTTHVLASLALEEHLASRPEDVGRFAVVPSWELPV